MFRVFTAVWCLQALPGVCMNLGLWVLGAAWVIISRPYVWGFGA